MNVFDQCLGINTQDNEKIQIKGHQIWCVILTFIDA